MTRQGLICPNRYSPSEASLTLKLKVGKKGYVIIPKAIREAAGVEEGDELIVSLNGLLSRPASSQRPFLFLLVFLILLYPVEHGIIQEIPLIPVETRSFQVIWRYIILDLWICSPLSLVWVFQPQIYTQSR